MSADFGTFEKDVLSERIVDRLMQMIRDKELRPGDRLPPERELAAMMGVSRPSLREALRALSIMKIIENRQGSGTYVTSLEPMRLVEHLDFIISLDDNTFLDLFQARKILEVGLVALAAQNITDEGLQGLEMCLERSEAILDDPAAFLQADLEMHQRIIDAADNNILALFMKSINDLNIASRKRTGEMRDVRLQTLQDHRMILAALRARNPQAASQAMREHLEHVEQKLKDMAASGEAQPGGKDS